MSDRSEPQPDLAILAWKDDFYAAGHPQTQDVLMLIEVADYTIEHDREEKLSLYAAAGIPVVWVVDINAQSIEVYSEPNNLMYQRREVFGRGVDWGLETFPDIRLSGDRILG